ncbi:hypothetical protein [Hydrococcus rivularis]|uniref:hypothetical protein n=1 Tax=Hydrococcus rivularis TaxID=1616834 RepID=UPI0011149D74|nr:hypothetical protein [Hydrococcus rivularis]
MFSSFAKAILALTSVASLFILVPAAKTQTVPSTSRVLPSTPKTQQIINGLSYPNSSQRFFEQGQRKFETEIKNLLERKYTRSESLLKIPDELLQHGFLSPTEELPAVLKKEDVKG